MEVDDEGGVEEILGTNMSPAMLKLPCTNHTCLKTRLCQLLQCTPKLNNQTAANSALEHGSQRHSRVCGGPTARGWLQHRQTAPAQPPSTSHALFHQWTAVAAPPKPTRWASLVASLKALQVGDHGLKWVIGGVHGPV